MSTKSKRNFLPNHRLIGLTGCIGAGKSLVAEAWRKLGAGVVSGDEMGRLALKSDASISLKLSERFGNTVLDENKNVVPAELASAAFSSPKGIEDLTRLTFPALYRLAKKNFAKLSKEHSVLVFDAALIFEWNIAADFDLITVVTSPIDALIERAAARLEIDISQAEARLNSQISQAEKADRADVILANDKSIADLEENAVMIWSEIMKQLEVMRSV